MIWLLLACIALADEPSDEEEEEGWEEDDDAGWGEDDDDGGDDDWGESDAVGFGDATPEPEEPEEKWTDFFSFGGTYRSDNALWLQRLEDEPVASVRHWLDLSLRFKRDIMLAEASLHADVDLAYLIQRDRYDDATFETYAYQFAPRNLFFEVAPGDLLLVSVGRQVVAWGEGLLLSPLDVVSPKDLRDPGVADLEELRLPISMVRVGLYPPGHRIEAILIPEPFYGHTATPAGPFGAVDDLVEGTEMGTLLEDKTLRFKHVQNDFLVDYFDLFLRYRYRGAGFDMSFYAASLLDDTGIVRLPTQEELAASDDIAIELDHRRYPMVGHSGNALVAAPLLVRWELAFDIAREFPVGDVTVPLPQIDTAARTLIQAMAGVEYSGLSRTTLLLEIRGAVFIGNGLWAEGGDLINLRPDDLVFPIDTETIAVRATHHVMRERLKFSAIALVFGIDARHGAQVWADADYELADGIALGAQVILPFPTDTHGPLFGLDEHHRLFVRLRIDF